MFAKNMQKINIFAFAIKLALGTVTALKVYHEHFYLVWWKNKNDKEDERFNHSFMKSERQTNEHPSFLFYKKIDLVFRSNFLEYFLFSCVERLNIFIRLV